MIKPDRLDVEIIEEEFDIDYELDLSEFEDRDMDGLENEER